MAVETGHAPSLQIMADFLAMTNTPSLRGGSEMTDAAISYSFNL